MDFCAPGELRPKESLRFAFVREQGYDRSCGYSAAASLLSLYWRIPADEEALIGRRGSGAPDSGRLDVNFGELASIFEEYGFSVKGARMTWEQLGTALERYAPLIVHYARPDRHFALALRARQGWIILLDPALGCEILSRSQFLERWSGAVLLVSSTEAERDEALLDEAARAGWDRRWLLERLGG
jgi:uncharacterized protein